MLVTQMGGLERETRVVRNDPSLRLHERRHTIGSSGALLP